jgi:hypothetical protein
MRDNVQRANADFRTQQHGRVEGCDLKAALLRREGG